MPIYEYCCSDCGHELEALQSVGAPQLLKCPACGKRKLQKKLSAAAFHLKGQGWYKTDFRDQGKKSPSEDKDKDKTAGKDDSAAKTSSSKSANNGADKSESSDRSKTSADAPAVASAGDASGKSV